MNKVKLRFIFIISLAVLFAVTLCCGILTMTGPSVYAALRDTTEIFRQGTNAAVRAYQEGEGEEAHAYTAFEFADGGNVYYRRDLALKWFEGKGEKKTFNLQFKFVGSNFSKFTMKFEGTEENITKDGKSENSLILENDDNNFNVIVKDSEGEEMTSPIPEEVDIIDEWLTLYFEEGDVGEFDVYVAIGDGVKEGEYVGTFTNIGANYLKYSSSEGQTPITFTAEVPDLEVPNQDPKPQRQILLLKELNGQTLEVSDGDVAETANDFGLYEVKNGKVADNKAPAVVLNEKVYAFTMGQRFTTSTISYVIIDVCDDSVTTKLQYYMYKEPEVDEGNEGDEQEGEEEEEDGIVYTDITSSKPAYFMPTHELDKESGDTECYVSIRINFNKNSGAGEDDYVYFAWYAANDDVVTKIDDTDYIVVRSDEKEGPRYFEEFEGEEQFESRWDAYQNAVDEVAKDANVGNGAYFYLPSLRNLIVSDYADYRNLKFSVYYYNVTQVSGDSAGETTGDAATSATGLSYNTLKFEVPREGWYRFRILASDAAGNAMKYELDGEKVTVTSSNIWDIEEIPEFTFYVSYKGVEIEDPGEKPSGFRDSTYSIEEFDVIGLDGIKKDYALYYFDESKLPEDEVMPTYSDFVKNANEWLNKDKEGYREEFRSYLTKIEKYNSDATDADDDEWGDNDYVWYQNEALSFVPQVKGFYVVELIVTDTNRSNKVDYAYQVIEVQNPFDYTPGQSEWLQNNVVSIVLFAVSAVLLVIVIALFVVKPSDKKVEEVDIKELKGQKKNK